MAHMNLVVELGAFANHRVAGYSAVDGASRANFHIITNYHPTAAAHFIIAFGTTLEIKGIRSNHRSGVDNHTIANDGMVVNGYVGMNEAITANFYMVADKASRLNVGSFANAGQGADHLPGGLIRHEKIDQKIIITEGVIANEQGFPRRTLNLFVN